jgi:hypothetical protein
MPIKATYFRQNLYQLLDKVALEGLVLEIERNGKILRVVPETTVSKFDRLEPHQSTVQDEDDLLGMDWTNEWKASGAETTPKKRGGNKSHSKRR